MGKKIDLHMHSSYSEDGELTPKQLVQMCAEAGIGQMAITDHNTVAGVDEAIECARHMNIDCSAAIEIDCTFNNVNFHVLGYDIDHRDKIFDEIEQNVRGQCLQASFKRLELINNLGFSLSERTLIEITNGNYWIESWSGEVFAQALLADEQYKFHELLKPYRNGGGRGDNPYVNFYWDFFSQGKPCYAEIIYPGMEEVIQNIHTVNGIAVLAHPGINLKNRFEMIDRLIALGLDGIEVFSSYHDTDTTRWLYDKAVTAHLKMTSGSDYHGKTKPSITLGSYSSV